jgi:inner membrane protein involved in colicin E2 resistance
LMLFSLLAAVMFVTRKVDWYGGRVGLIQGKAGLGQTPPPLA